MSKVKEIAWENYKGLPDGKLTLENADSLLLEGPNGSGKTSLVQILSMLARDGESQEPLKHGEQNGYYQLRVLHGKDEFLLKRVFDVQGRDTYQVKQNGGGLKKEDGTRQVPNKKWFQTFFNAPSFDPLGLVSKKMKDLVDDLFQITGYDGSEHDRKIAELYAKRTDVYRDRKYKEGFIEELSIEPEDILKYKEKVDVLDLSKEIAEAGQHQERISMERASMNDLYSKTQEKGLLLKQKLEALEALKKEIDSIKEEGKTLQAQYLEKKANVASMEGNVPDLSGLQDRFDNAEKHNEMVMKVDSYNKARDEYDELDKKWKSLDAQVEEAREEKIQAVLSLKFPDPNLFIDTTISEDKVIYEIRYRLPDGTDIPFREGDMNTAKLIEVAVRLKLQMLQLNDQFPIMRIDCSALDHTTIETVVDMLAQEGVFGVLEKALGRQGVDTLQYKLLGEMAVNGSLEGVESDGAMEWPEKVAEFLPKKRDELIIDDPNGPWGPEGQTPPDDSDEDIDLTKMFDQ